MKISFDEPDLPRSGAVVVGIWEEGALTASARRLDEATSGAITRALGAATRFSGKKDEFLPIIAPANLSVSRILLAGLGKPGAIDARSLQQLGGKLFANLNGAGEKDQPLPSRSARVPPSASPRLPPSWRLAHTSGRTASTSTRRNRNPSRSRPWPA